MATTKLWTVAELDELDAGDDQQQYELTRGSLVTSEMSGFRHTSIGMRLGGHLMLHAEAQHLGMVTGSNGGCVFQRDPDTVLIPDIAFIQIENLPPEDTWQRRPAQAPDLIVKIPSSSNRPDQIQRKIAIYLALGVQLVWLVDPDERTITHSAHGQEPRVLHERDHLDGGDVLPGFRLPVSSVFSPFSAPLS